MPPRGAAFNATSICARDRRTSAFFLARESRAFAGTWRRASTECFHIQIFSRARKRGRVQVARLRGVDRVACSVTMQAVNFLIRNQFADPCNPLKSCPFFRRVYEENQSASLKFPPPKKINSTLTALRNRLPNRCQTPRVAIKCLVCCKRLLLHYTKPGNHQLSSV